MKHAIGIIRALNPIGNISDSISSICDYKKQARLIDADKERVLNEAKLYHRKIEAAEKGFVKTLKLKDIHLSKIIDTGSKVLEADCIDRHKYANSLVKLSSSFSEIEDADSRGARLEAMQLLSSTIAESSEKSVLKFNSLVERVSDNLQLSNIENKFLNGGQ